MTAARTFAEWALSVGIDDVPLQARDAAKRHLLDGFGCAVAAARLGEAGYALAAARTLGTADEATAIATGDVLSAPAAALVNGTLVHALDFDDTHAGALVHATAAVLPAAFAVGEATDASGADVLTAAIAGYETVIRLGAAVPHGFHARGLHATSVCGVFASALIASKLMGLSVEQTVNALGIAGSMASGSLEFLVTGSNTKQLHPGLAGMNGIVAASLAAEGAEGPASIFEGEYGLYKTLTDVAPDGGNIAEGLGERWEVTRITIKPYPVCQLSHASLDALRTLLPKLSDPQEIDRITLKVPKDAVPIVCEPRSEKDAPRTSYEGKFSLQYCAATLIVDGEIGVGSFDALHLQRTTPRSLAQRIDYEVTDVSPPAEAPGDVTVTLKNGERLHAAIPQSRGGPDAPVSDDELMAKFAGNAGGHLSTVVDAFRGLEEVVSVRDWVRGAFVVPTVGA